MSRQQILTGIDIGTSKICALIAGVKEEGTYEVKGLGLVPSHGLKKGLVIDIDETVQSIRKAVEKAEQMAGLKIEEAVIGIAGSHITSLNSHGVVAVSDEDREIRQEDVKRVIEASRIISLPPDREIIHVIPREFIVDGCRGIKDPCGMSGKRLEVESHIVSGSAASIQNLVKSVTRADLKVVKLILEPLAASLAVLSYDEMELGVALVDIGGGTTDLAIFKEGSILFTSVLPIGGDHLTNDLAIGLRTPLSSAEKIKKTYGSASQELAEKIENILVLSTSGEEERRSNGRELLAIIEPRIHEIISLVKKELYDSTFLELLPAGMVVTGGGSLMYGFLERFSSRLDLPVRRGIPRLMPGIVDFADSSIYLNEELIPREQKGAIFATGVGLIRYARDSGFGEDTVKRRKKRRFSPFDLLKKINEWLQDFF